MLEPEALLRLPEGATAPGFSPDGAWLAYLEAGRAWVVPVAAVAGDGAARRARSGRAAPSAGTRPATR
jgi:hypothetical protein